MPIPDTRIRYFEEKRNFGKIDSEFELSDLTRIQTASYERFLQLDILPRERKNHGLEEILREVFPVESYDGQYRLEYGVTSPDFKWMRLYSGGDNEVIADRRFRGEVPYKINWYEKRVNVGGADEATISLPPHWWERWTAKLP